ncbi:CoA transferase [Sphingomonas gilva]|uniref:CoA transferase n=1 Tax=Sphingomonas gilva TaxID=2305907 RepID=A0A396RRK9_9SPHN|nr:CaiB/BaiF CoA-transferase family protein [Sphingomonas gilva]RHW19274.1 CoA transferase [Sphingomonas gilva]
MKALEGVRVLDFTHAISGPTCTGMLALLGAEVIKVEKPGVGDSLRSYTEHAGPPLMSTPFGAVNNGKRSIVADLKHPAAREVLLQMAETVDIVVENFRPGVLKRLGYGPDVLRARNPRLIYASITGFGQTGSLRNWGAYDHIVQAMSGLAMLNAAVDGPKMIGIPLIDAFSGYVGVMAILASLQKRHVTGEGETIDVAMLDSALRLMNTNVSTYFWTGVAPKSMANRGFRLVATSEFYQTRDGWIALGANHQDQIKAFLDVVGHPEILDDPRFATHKLRVENYDALKAWLTDFFLTQSAEELEPRLAAAKVPVSRIRDIEQIASHPHFQERALFHEAEIPGSDKPLVAVGPGFLLESGPIEPGPVPRLGESTDAVLGELGIAPDEIARLREEGAFG